MSLELGTTQRRSPLAYEKSDCAAAAPRQLRVFTASEGTKFKTPTLFRIRPHNAAVERRRDEVCSAPRVHNEVTHMRRASDWV
jgi:hypothetical protein